LSISTFEVWCYCYCPLERISCHDPSDPKLKLVGHGWAEQHEPSLPSTTEEVHVAQDSSSAQANLVEMQAMLQIAEEKTADIYGTIATYTSLFNISRSCCFFITAKRKLKEQ